MALESLPKISPANFSPDNDLIQVYSKRGDYVGVINPSYIKSSPSGVSGAIQFSDGSAFASDAANLFWDDTNNRLGIGTNAPLEKLHVNGKGIFGTGNAGDSYVKIEEGSYAGKIARITFNDFDGGTGSRGGWLELGTYNGQIRYGSYNSFFIGTSIKPYKFYIKDSSDNVIISNGNIAPTDSGALLQVKGTGSTSATTSLLVQNSGGGSALQVTDDKKIGVGNTIYQSFSSSVSNVLLSTHTTSTINDTGIYAPGGNAFGVSVQGTRKAYVNSHWQFNGGICAQPDGTGTSLDNSAILQAESTTKGFLPPRMTTAQRTAISSPAAGLVVFDTTLQNLCFFRDGVWVQCSFTAA